MEVYYSIFIVSFLLCFFDFILIKQVKRLVYTLFTIFLVLLVGRRKTGIDNDSPMYEGMYYFYREVSINDVLKGGYGYVEKGYVFFNQFIGFFGGDFWTLTLSMSIVTGLLTYSFIFKKSKLPFLSLLFYLSFFFLYRDFTQIRYALSSSLIFWCCLFYINKRYKYAILLFLLAISFHNAAFIIIPTLAVIYFIKKKEIYLLIIIPCMLIGVVYNPFPLLLASGLSNEHMQLYVNEEGGGSWSISIVGLVVLLLYYFLLKYNKNKFKTLDANPYFGDYYFKLVALSTSLNFLFIQSAVFQRFSLILYQFVIILFPFVVYGYSKISHRKETYMILYFFCSLFLLLYGFRMIDEKLVRPYEFSSLW